MLFYLESLHEKKKAVWIGKMALGLAKNRINMEQFDLSVFAIKNSMPGDLNLLKKVFEQAINERRNNLISDTDKEWFKKYMFKYIGLHYYDELDELQKLTKRTINHFLSIGIIERELKEIKKSARNLGLDGGGSIIEGYREIYSFSETASLIFQLALQD